MHVSKKMDAVVFFIVVSKVLFKSPDTMSERGRKPLDDSLELSKLFDAKPSDYARSPKSERLRSEYKVKSELCL